MKLLLGSVLLCFLVYIFFCNTTLLIFRIYQIVVGRFVYSDCCGFSNKEIHS